MNAQQTKVCCMLCNKEFLRITNSHLIRKHGISLKQYTQLFGSVAIVPKSKLHLCSCGCGETISIYRRYAKGHWKLKLKKEKEEMLDPNHLCKCGCGSVIKINKSFVQGHQIRLKNPNYKHGKTQKWRDWKAAVFDRDGHVCKICFGTERLHPHHIKSRKEFPELTFDVDNGLTLCIHCHYSLHNTGRNNPNYGKGLFGDKNPMFGKKGVEHPSYGNHYIRKKDVKRHWKKENGKRVYYQ